MFNLNRFPELKSKDLIGIGEIVHGSSGLHEIEFNLIQSAILQLESRSVGIEAPANIVSRINQQLDPSFRDPPTQTTLSELYPIWRSIPFLNGLKWIFDFNHRPENQTNPVHLFGFDVRLPLSELRDLANWSKEQNSSDILLTRYAKISLTELRSLEMLSHEMKQDQALIEFEEILSAIGRLLAQKNLPKQIESTALTIEAWAEIYKTWATSGMERAYAERDKKMAKSLLHQLRSYRSGGPTIILAHLNHLLFNNLKVRDAKSHVVAGPVLGNYLHHALSSKYSLMGLLPNQIEIANAGGGGVIETFKAKPLSYESELQSFSNGTHLLRIKDLPNQLQDWGRIGNVEPIGSQLLQTYSSFEMRPSEQMDYVVTIDQVTCLGKEAK